MHFSSFLSCSENKGILVLQNGLMARIDRCKINANLKLSYSFDLNCILRWKSFILSVKILAVGIDVTCKMKYVPFYLLSVKSLKTCMELYLLL